MCTFSGSGRVALQRAELRTGWIPVSRKACACGLSLTVNFGDPDEAASRQVPPGFGRQPPGVASGLAGSSGKLTMETGSALQGLESIRSPKFR
jgi:hypothetical protein